MSSSKHSAANSDIPRADFERTEAQLRARLIPHDDAPWLSSLFSPSTTPPLRHVAGVDISFLPNDATTAVAALVVLSFPSLSLIYEEYRTVRLDAPYVPGYLAFREAAHLVSLLDALRASRADIFPDVVLVDGNGVMHPRGFGVACHVGVLACVPTIGVAKKVFAVDGMDARAVKDGAKRALVRKGDRVEMRGASGTVWGIAVRVSEESCNPVYVSVGHRVGLEAAVEVVLRTSIHRVPEPIRKADLGSRAVVRTMTNS